MRPQTPFDAVDADGADRIVDLELVEEEDATRSTSTPATAPMMKAPTGVTKAHGEVIATRPASMLLHIIEGSGLPCTFHM